jgi:hypothetical protein
MTPSHENSKPRRLPQIFSVNIRAFPCSARRNADAFRPSKFHPVQIMTLQQSSFAPKNKHPPAK